MSNQDRTALHAAELEHERARTLVSWSIDEELPLEDATWLAQHLGGCAECREAASDLRALHEELRSLPLPEVPRDLWARTSAGLDRVDRERARRSSGSRSISDWLSGLGLETLKGSRVYVGAVAVVVVVAVVGVSFFTRSTPPPAPASGAPTNYAVVTGSSSTQQPALTVVGGTSYWVAPVNGVYQIRGASTECNGTPKNCTLTNGNGTVLGSVQSKTPVTVAISPNAKNAAVWNADKVVILPLSTQPATVSLDTLTPLPVATPVATASPTPAPTATAEASQTPEPSEAAVSQEPTEAATATPAATQQPTPTVAPTPVTTPAGPQPTAILSGYKIVGRNPEFSPDGQWIAFAARQTGQAGGSDVFVWHQGWQRAMPIRSGYGDLFAGWAGSRILLSTVVTVNPQQDQSSTPAPADSSEPAGSAEPSEAADATPTAQPASSGPVNVAVSDIYDPISGKFLRADEPMFMPVVDPTGHFVVYWSGTMQLDPASGLWAPGTGGLYFADWSSIHFVADPQPEPPAGSPAPTTSADASAPSDVSPSPSAVGFTGQLLALSTTPPSGQPVPVGTVPHSATGWLVKWDQTGEYVAVWVARNAGASSGKVSVMDVIPGTSSLNPQPLLTVDARPNITFDHATFIYTAPQSDGDKTYVFTLPSVPPLPSTQATGAPVTSPAESPAS